MHFKKKDKPLFCGLTHVGQVFSIGWTEKIGNCAVFDFEKKKLENFKNFKVTNEEPSLKRIFKKKLQKNRIHRYTIKYKKF